MEVRDGYKATDVGLIPFDWRIVNLGDVSVISRLAGAEYTSLWHETPTGEIIALRGFNIGQGKIVDRDIVRITNSLSIKLKRSRLCKGDVVYPCVGSIGNAVVIDEDNKYHIQQNIARITPASMLISSRYLANYLMSFLGMREVERFNSSSSQPSVLVGNLRLYRIALPPTKAEQEVIASHIADVDALIAGLEKLIAKKRDLKQAVMQQLLTGQTRLPGFSGDWVVKALGDITNIKTGSRNNEDKVEDGLYPFFVRSAHVERINSYSHECEAILIPGEGQIGDIFHYINGRFDVHQRVYAITQFVEGVSGKYIHLYMSQHFGEWAMQNTVKATVDSLRLPTFQTFQVQLPPTIEEQTAIAQMLSDLDAELLAIEMRLSKTRELKQGMMQELLTGRTRLV